MQVHLGELCQSGPLGHARLLSIKTIIQKNERQLSGIGGNGLE